MPIVDSITSARDFRRVYGARRVRRDGLTIFASAREDGELPRRPRLGLAVGAGAGTAVERNRIKRRLREAVRAATPAPGFDVVIRASHEAASRTYRQIAADVGDALARLGVTEERS